MSLPPPGSTVPFRKHLENVWKQSKKKPKQLADIPPLPEECEYLWRWYLELHGREQITFQEIQSWSQLTAKQVNPLEVEVLRKLDFIRWEVIDENGRRNHKTNNPSPKHRGRNG